MVKTIENYAKKTEEPLSYRNRDNRVAIIDI